MSYFAYSFVFDLLKAELMSIGKWKEFLKLHPAEAQRQRSLQLGDMLKILEGEKDA